MISTKNWTEIMGFKVESNLNIVEWTWTNTNWTRFPLNITQYKGRAKFIIRDKYFDQGHKNDFDQK